VRPVGGRPANELWPVIQDQLLGPSTLVCQSIEDLDNPASGQGGIHLAGKPSLAERIHDVEGPELPARHEPILDEIHSAPLIQAGRERQARPREAHSLLPSTPADGQAFLAIEPVDSLVIDPETDLEHLSRM
jgi:hypothetical protein